MKRKRGEKTTLQVPVILPADMKLPSEFECYLITKTASDLLALEAQKIWRRMFDGLGGNRKVDK